MSRRDQVTLDLFEIPRAAAPVPASMDFRAEVSQLLSAMLASAAAAGIDRWEVSARASRLAGRDITKAMLDGYTSEARDEFNVPFWIVPVLEIVCSSCSACDWHASKLGGRARYGAATLDAEIGRLEHVANEASAQARELKALRRRVR